jgi:outer membrane protein assembly factor BamB
MFKNITLVVATFVFMLIFVSAGYVDAQLANSAWPMFHHDASHYGKSPYVGPQSATLKWKFAVGGCIDSSPAIGIDGTIYVGTGFNTVIAANPDGSIRWTYETLSVINSSPAIDKNGTIYIGSDDKNLYALNSNGTLKWSFYAGEGQVNTSPAISDNGTIYFGSESNYLFAVNPDGSEKWRFKAGDIIDSSPAIGSDGVIYFGSQDKKLYAVNPDGSLKWSFETNGRIDSTPLVTGGAVYVGCIDGVWNFYAIKTDGTELWKINIGSHVSSSPAIVNDFDLTIYVGCDDYNLYALESWNGNIKWTFPTEGPITSSPILGADGTIYFGSCDHYFYAVNPDGTEKWKYETQSDIRSSAAIASDGTLYFGSDDTYFYAIQGTELGLDISSNKRSYTWGDIVKINISVNNPHGETYDLYAATIIDDYYICWYPTWDMHLQKTEINTNTWEKQILEIPAVFLKPNTFTFYAALAEHDTTNIMILDSVTIN